MKFVPLMLLLTLAAACGQNGGDGGNASADSKGLCNLNGNAVPCSSVSESDGMGVDLLEVMVDVPVKIQGADITFLSDKSSVLKGRRIDCSLNVKNGEVYRYAIRGDKLLLMTSEGSFEMEKTSDGEGINGAWFWQGYIEEGIHILRHITVISPNRMIFRTTCEL